MRLQNFIVNLYVDVDILLDEKEGDFEPSDPTATYATTSAGFWQRKMVQNGGWMLVELAARISSL